MSGCYKHLSEFFSSLKDVEFLVVFASSLKARFVSHVRPPLCLSVCLLVYVTVRLSACINATPTGRIFVKFEIGDLYENVNKLYVSLKSGKNIEHFTCWPKCVSCCCQ
jgi:hypothetical protein